MHVAESAAADSQPAQRQSIQSYYATILYREPIAQTLRIGAITKEMS